MTLHFKTSKVLHVQLGPGTPQFHASPLSLIPMRPILIPLNLTYPNHLEALTGNFLIHCQLTLVSQTSPPALLRLLLEITHTELPQTTLETVKDSKGGISGKSVLTAHKHKFTLRTTGRSMNLMDRSTSLLDRLEAAEMTT